MTPAFVAIPGGEFLMGSEGGHEDERPVHRVKVRPFLLGRTQVTNAQYGAPGDPDLPVTSVNWFDAVEFCAPVRARCKTPSRCSGNAGRSGI